ncbi:branched-chain amino acid ABC transporter permease [Anaeromyxobacter oryzisoli]|uniref:branched-chain amino acid ABC transporter permease n=1 Tax=Anaeromyxobacter oryzisoli TaxID=2925408 RepID=UPI001F56EFB6|nr:branched-chain amino acid ABC transporter permease [Anaeromyxobacter sp. SG63]
MARAVLLAVVLAALLLVPSLVSPYTLLTYTSALCLALMAQGWNLIGGYTGYAAFGNVAFVGIGAYTTGLLMLSRWHVPFVPALFAAALVSALLATVIGIPVLRLKGHYFAIATLGVAEAFREIASAWDDLTNGATGIDLPVRSDSRFFYYVALALVVGGIVITARLERSKLGYGWVAIREDQDAARMLGIDTTVFKVAAFALSAAFAACAGGIIAYQDIHVAPDDFFKIEYTLQMIIACIIGGTGTVWGPPVGAAVYQLLSTYVWSHFLELHPTVLGVLIILFVVFLPRGLMDLFRRMAAVARGGRFGSDVFLANVRASRLE